MAYNVISIEDLNEAIGEEKLKELLKSFKCELNKDVENYLHNSAIQFFKMGMSNTFLVFTSYKEENVLVGYFALTNKITKIKKKSLSNTMGKRIKRFTQNDEFNNYYIVSLPLIGQLGKNYDNGYNKLISGDILLKLACDKIREAQRVLGGRFVFIECEDKPELIEFYESNGFVYFGKRNLERDERDSNSGQYLLQMLSYLGNYDT